MNRFVIVDGLPFLFANGKAFKVRWDDKGFTVGAEVELTSAPTTLYSEISIKAKCAGNLDSIQDNQELIDDGQGASDDTGNQDGKQETPGGANNQDDGQGVSNDVSDIGSNLDKMKLEELKQYASENNVELKGARTKAEIIKAIKSTMNE